MKSTVRSFLVVGVGSLAVLCTGCGGKGNIGGDGLNRNAPPGVSATYTRPGTDIHIDFANCNNRPGGGNCAFTPDQTAAMTKTLDGFSTSDLDKAVIGEIDPMNTGPGATVDWSVRFSYIDLTVPSNATPQAVANALQAAVQACINTPVNQRVPYGPSGSVPADGSTPSPMASQQHATQPTVPDTTPPNATNATSIGTTNVEVTSRNSPDTYLAITSHDGMHAVMDDYNMTQNAAHHKVTEQDVIRGHGDFRVNTQQ